MLNFFGLGDYTDEEFKSDSRLLHKYIKECDTKKIKKLFSNQKKSKLLLSLDELDQIPLVIAARSNSLEVFELILSFYRQLKVDINTPDKNGYTCLHHFSSMSDLDVKMFLILLETEDLSLNITNRDLNTPFHYFCQKFKCANNAQFKEVFELLIKKQVDVNVINKNGESPLHKACFNITNAPNMITLLLENKANVNICNKNGESPLHYCVRMGRADLVAILLQYGADKNARAKDNKPLYQLAIEENFTKLADLLKEGADLTNTNATELSALLQNPTLREDFRNFLREDLYCEENISFWSDVEAYKYLKVDIFRLFKEFYRITEKYIYNDSPSEINVPHSIKKEVIEFSKTLPTLEDLNLTSSLSSSPSSSSCNHNIATNNHHHHNSTQSSTTPFSISVSASRSFESSTPPSLTPSPISLTMSTASPEQLQILSGFDQEKIQSVFNKAQSHIFNLMASDSLAKYKKKSVK